MRFPVFANDLGRAFPAEIDVERIEQLNHFLIAAFVTRLQLPLRKALQEAAASLAIGLRMSIDALEKRIGD